MNKISLKTNTPKNMHKKIPSLLCFVCLFSYLCGTSGALSAQVPYSTSQPIFPGLLAQALPLPGASVQPAGSPWAPIPEPSPASTPADCPSSPAVPSASPTYRLLENIPYRQEGDAYSLQRCKLDLYYPEHGADLPVVVWFHGGGLTGGSKFIPEELKKENLIVVAVNYRLLPHVGLSACLDDAAAATAWTFREIGKYGGNTRQIIVCGHSAGGYLTSMIGLDKKWLDAYDIDADSIAALIPFSGHAISHFAYRKAKGMKETQPSIDEFAPLYYVRPDAPPLIIVSGDREMEMLGRYEENAYFWRMMKVAGHKETYLYELGGYDHGSMASPAFHILKNHLKKIRNDNR